jgi:hypothetical protein
MGNSPATIFRHYRQLVKPKHAELYWKLIPVAVTFKFFTAQRSLRLFVNDRQTNGFTERREG